MHVLAREFEQGRAGIRCVAIVIDQENAQRSCRGKLSRISLDPVRQRGRCTADRQVHNELAPLVCALAEGFDVAAVQGHETADQRQSDAESAFGTPREGIALKEGYEESGQHLAGNPDPVVAYPDLDLPVINACTHIDTPAGIGVLSRIGEQVGKNLG